MKKLVLGAIAACLSIVLIQSCGNGAKAEREVPAKRNLVDLSKYGKPFTFFVPDSTIAKGDIQITEQNYMLEVKRGRHFGLVIEEGEGNMEQLKTDLQGDEINKFKEWLVQEPNLLAWTSEITATESHFYAIVTVGNAKYVVKDLTSTDNEPYTADDVKLMVECVKSILEKPVEAK